MKIHNCNVSIENTISSGILGNFITNFNLIDCENNLLIGRLCTFQRRANIKAMEKWQMN